ncbi:MAG TPA: glycoside hydrolase family 30 beta sandwich domain-containing protein [Candidatus Hydrogenedentes bacterium]|nr:glycoside hydrolase family 30 beta sandwich domain-containing protein [Candidatus Hydrogenedentota bacterium]
MTRMVIVFAAIFVLMLAAVADDSVQVVMSCQNGSKSLSEEKTLHFGKVRKVKGPVIEVDLSKKFQSILGLGASFDHSTCENLSKLSAEKREEVLDKLMNPKTGIGMNLMRVCIGASDFIGEPYYTYNDLPEGQTDPELTQFSIEKDRVYVLPAIKIAQQKNPGLLFFGSPWSPPAWMKTSGKLGTGSLKRECYPAFAKYLVKFIQAYEAEGVPMHAITVQNEPHMSDKEYPTTLWTGEEERDFIRDHLGPLFRQNNVKTLIWCWDHNWNEPEFPRTILSDPQAAQYVDGTGWHLYEGKVETQSAFKAEFPDKHIYFTEGSLFRPNGAIRLTHILRNWSRSYNAWVIMLDEHRKPNRGPHSASATCIELLDDGSVRYNFDYYMQGQFMKFILREAVRVESSLPDMRSFGNAAFVNPGGQVVLVAANSSRSEQPFAVKCGEKMFRTELPGGSVGTYMWQAEQ